MDNEKSLEGLKELIFCESSSEMKVKYSSLLKSLAHLFFNEAYEGNLLPENVFTKGEIMGKVFELLKLYQWHIEFCELLQEEMKKLE